MKKTQSVLEVCAWPVHWSAAAEAAYHGRPHPATTYWYVRITDPQNPDSYYDRYVGTDEPSQDAMRSTANELLEEIRRKLQKQADDLAKLAKSLRLSAD